MSDIINRPPHYTATPIEPIDVIEAWKLGFCLGNAVKYIARHEHKGSALADLKKARWYIVEGGQWVWVDFTDNVFSRVISSKSGVKKVKTESGKILFVVHDENGNSAHGETIKQAREDLVYKAVAKFVGELPAKATGKEWVGIYRAVTGACAAGVKDFVEQTGKSLDDTYTAKQIAALVKGNYGADKFAEKAREK